MWIVDHCGLVSKQPITIKNPWSGKETKVKKP
jgi:hypothetical protein